MAQPGSKATDLFSAGYSELAEAWAAVVEPTLVPVYARLVDLVGAGPRVRLLDLGCGAGGVVRAALERGAAVGGIDVAPGMIRVAQRLAPTAEFSVGGVACMPFKDQVFDGATAAFLFHHLRHVQPLWRETRRVLRPGATLAAATWGVPVEAPSFAAVLGVLRRHLGPGHNAFAGLLTDRPWRTLAAARAALHKGGWIEVSAEAEPIEIDFLDASAVVDWVLAQPDYALRVADRGESEVGRIREECEDAAHSAGTSWRIPINYLSARAP